MKNHHPIQHDKKLKLALFELYEDEVKKTKKDFSRIKHFSPTRCLQVMNLTK